MYVVRFKINEAELHRIQKMNKSKTTDDILALWSQQLTEQLNKNPMTTDDLRDNNMMG